MRRHVPAQVSFPEDFVAECLALFVEHTPAIMRRVDQEAAAATLGISPGKADAATHRPEGLRLKREEFLARWKKDRPAAMQMLAVALFFQGRDYHKQLRARDAATWTTGRTHEQAQEVAKQAIKDRDAGFKDLAMADGVLCDHCDEPATLRKKSVNVCSSAVFDKVTEASMMRRRLARSDAKAAKANGAKAEAKPAKNGKAHAKPTGKAGAKGRPKAAAGA